MLDKLIPHADMKPDNVSMNSAKKSSLMKNGKSHTNTAKYGSQAEMVWRTKADPDEDIDTFTDIVIAFSNQCQWGTRM